MHRLRTTILAAAALAAAPPELGRLFDELAAPRLPTPFSLPELSHDDVDASLAWTVGAAAPEEPGRGASTIALVRASGEARIRSLRRVYLGATCPLAFGLPVTGTGGNEALIGNVDAGVLATQDFEISVEASQLYFFATDVPDDKRTALTVGPRARWALGPVDVGVGAVTSLFSPLADGMDRFLAARVSVVAHVE